MIDIVLSLIYSSIHFIYFQQKEKILIFQQHTDSNFFYTLFSGRCFTEVTILPSNLIESTVFIAFFLQNMQAHTKKLKTVQLYSALSGLQCV